jgi:adenosylcobinamide-GDP ribazoletransferase
MNAFWHAVAFLTRFPVPRNLGDEGRTASTVWYPLVGLILGAILAMFDTLVAVWFPAPVRAALVVTAWIWLTGGLHLDGWMDAADGLGSWSDARKTLQIMKDSRVGAMGVMAGVSGILVKFSLVFSLPPSWTERIVALSCACCLGRFAALWGMYFFPYVSPEGGASSLKEGLTGSRFALAAALTALPVLLLTGWEGAVASAVSLAVVTLFGWRATRRLGGLTGDLYGAMVVLTEILVLMSFN